MGTTSHRPPALATLTYVVRIWKSGCFMAALRRVDQEAPRLFDDAAALARYLEAESEQAILSTGRREPIGSKYLLIESRDPHGSSDPHGYAALASQLKAAGHEVALFLVQNGVVPGCSDMHCPALRDALVAHVEVLADEYSLRERGIDKARLVAGVGVAPIGLVIERLAAGWKTLWH
jgi:hypothetical protein